MRDSCLLWIEGIEGILTLSFEIAFVRFMASTEGRLAWKYDVMLVKDVMFDEKRRKIVVHDFDANVAILGICADRSALTRSVSIDRALETSTSAIGE